MFVSPTVKNLPPGRFSRQLCPCCLFLQLETNSWCLTWYWAVILTFQKKITETSVRCDLGAAGHDLDQLTQTEWHLGGLSHVPCFPWLSCSFQKNYLTAKSSESCLRNMRLEGVLKDESEANAILMQLRLKTCYNRDLPRIWFYIPLDTAPVQWWVISS